MFIHTLINAWHGKLPDNALLAERVGHKAPTSMPIKVTPASIGAASRWDTAHPYNRWALMGNCRQPDPGWIERLMVEWL